jgi:hypothetical protein
MREPIEETEIQQARSLFSRSPFRSIYFLGTSIAFLGDILYMCFLAYKHWDGISSTEVVTSVLVGCFLVNAYRSAFDGYNRLHAEISSYTPNLLSGADPSSDVALGVASGTFFHTSFLFFAVALLLTQIGSLLDRVGCVPRP